MKKLLPLLFLIAWANFSFAQCSFPTGQAKGFATSAVGDNEMTVHWTRADNANSVLVVAKEGAPVDQEPTSGQAYTGIANFGSGEEIGTKNYVVFSGNADNVTLTNLAADTEYYFAIYEYKAGNCYKTPALRGSQRTSTYCTPGAAQDDSTGVTHVEFNNVINQQGFGDGLPAYTDYTADADKKIRIVKGMPYDLTVKVNTGGDFKAFAKAWIDWNQDGDFDDAGEEYDLGWRKNSKRRQTSKCPLAITSPTDAKLGETRMRVRAIYEAEGAPVSCGSQNYGEAEDYTLNVVPNYGLRDDGGVNLPTVTYWHTGLTSDVTEKGDAYDGKDFGQIGELKIKGAAIKVWKNTGDGGDVQGTTFSYKVWKGSSEPTDYTTVSVLHTSDDGGTGGVTNQIWANFGSEVDITAGLATTGKYNLKILFSVQGVTGVEIEENGPFTASFFYNHIPTLTKFNNPVAATDEEKEVTITCQNLKDEGDEDDSDASGSVVAFVVTEAPADSGTLFIGDTRENANPFHPEDNCTIGDIDGKKYKAFWTPAEGKTGDVEAFKVVAKDNDGGLSTPAVAVPVTVNKVPDFTKFDPNPVATTEEDVAVTLTFAELLAKSDVSGDATVTSFKVTDVPAANGSLKIGGLNFSSGSVDVIEAGKDAEWTPKLDTSGAAIDAFIVLAQNTNGGLSKDSVTAQIKVTAKNDVPELTKFNPNPVDTINEGTTATLTFQYLLSVSDAKDKDGTVTGFKVTDVPAANGSLKIGGLDFSSGSVDVIEAGKDAVWTPTVSGEPTAFKVKAQDDSSAVSGTEIEVKIRVNQLPTFTTLGNSVAEVLVGEETEITFAEIAAQGDEADTDGSVVAFVVTEAPSNGTLRIGANAVSAAAYSSDNCTIDETHKAYWKSNATSATTGEDAFKLKAKDNEGAMSSTTPVMAKVDVKAASANADPTFTSFDTNPVKTTNENTQVKITFAELLAASDAVDTDGYIQAFIVKQATLEGELKIGTNAANATGVTATNKTIDATHNAYWKPVNTTGDVDAFKAVVQDNKGAFSAGDGIMAKIKVNKAPTLTKFNAVVQTKNEDTETEITFDNLKDNSDAADNDGSVAAFIVKSVTAKGTLKIGTDATSATNYDASTNCTIGTIGGTEYKAYWTPATDSTGTLDAFAVLAQDNDGATSALPAVTAQVSVTPINDAPEFTTLANPVATTQKVKEVEITFAEIAAKADTSDVDGHIVAFVVKSLSSGALKIGGDAVSAQDFLAGTVNVIDENNNAYWTPAPGAVGLKDAFTVVAKDNDGATSDLPAVTAQVQINATNAAPTFTKFNAVVNSVDEDTQVEISFDNLFDNSDANDEDGHVVAFVVKSLSSGALKIGGDAGSAQDFQAGVDTINATNKAYWTPAENVNGDSVAAFEVVAIDDNGAASTTPVSVTAHVKVKDINDVPTLNAFSAPVATTKEDTEVEITLAALLDKGDEADVDGTVEAFVVKQVVTANGTLKIGADTGSAVAFDATHNTIDANTNAYWTPATGVVLGATDAFEVVAQDDDGGESTGDVMVQVNIRNPIDLSGVGVNVAADSITGTTIEMEFSLNSTDGTDGDWFACTAPRTSVTFTGECKVYVRDVVYHDTNRMVKELVQPAAPTFAVDFENEKTAEQISDEYEYADNENMTSAAAGTGVELDVTPGADLYFVKKATADSLASKVQHLEVPARPAVPTATVDLPTAIDARILLDGELAKESDGLAYCLDPADPANLIFVDVEDDTKLDLRGAHDLIVRLKATATSFKSDTTANLDTDDSTEDIWNGDIWSWRIPPSLKTDVAILRGDYTLGESEPALDTLVAKDLTVESDFTLEVLPENRVWIENKLTVEADAQVILKDNYEQGMRTDNLPMAAPGVLYANDIDNDGTMKVERWMNGGTTNENGRELLITHLVSSPVSAQDLNALAPFGIFKDLNDQGLLRNTQDTEMEKGKGYEFMNANDQAEIVFKADAGETFNFGNLMKECYAPTTMTFWGTTFTLPIPTYLGNPYTFPIDIDKLTFGPNIENQVHFMKNGRYVTYVRNSGTGVGDEPNVVPVANAFRVRATDATGRDVTFSHAAYVESNKEYNKSDNYIADMIRLEILDNKNDEFHQAIVMFRPDATEGFDSEYDAEKLFENNPAIPHLYTFTPKKEALIINTLPQAEETDIIPVAMKAKVGKYTISAKELNLNRFATVYLQDTETGKIVDLSTNDYTFKHEGGETAGRFVLRFNDISSKGEMFTRGEISAFAYKDILTITNPNETVRAEVSVYDLMGRNVQAEQIMLTPRTELKIAQPVGQYLVKISTESETKVLKVMIQR